MMAQRLSGYQLPINNKNNINRSPMTMNEQHLNQNLIERVTIGDMLRRRARDSANRTAIVAFDDQGRHQITYQALNSQANQLARGLRKQGLAQGDTLALLATNSIEFFITMFACYKAGLVVVPINFLQNLDDIHYNLQQAKIKAVISEPRFMPLTHGAHLTDIELRIAIGQASDDSLRFTDLMAGQDDSNLDDIMINDRDTAQIIFSSGTTSKAKGIETSHLSLYMTSMSTPLSMGFTKFHHHLAVLPTFHCASLTFCLSTLQLSGKLVLLPAFAPDSVAKIIEAEQVHSTGLLPMMWQGLLALPNLMDFDFNSLSTGLYAMAAMDSGTLNALRETFSGCAFHLGSGQSEFTPCACVFYDNSATEFATGNYWGVPAITTDQAILDENGQEVPQGQQGEICWRGPQAMSRYLGNETASNEASKFGWHHSGDLGLIDNQGQLLFVDRIKDMIKSGGENVASVKVEQALLECPNIVQVAVFGLAHPQWMEAVCAVVKVAPDSQFNEAEILQHCKSLLAGYEVPKRILLVQEFPLTATGKIQKNALREQYRHLFQ